MRPLDMKISFVSTLKPLKYLNTYHFHSRREHDKVQIFSRNSIGKYQKSYDTYNDTVNTFRASTVTDAHARKAYLPSNLDGTTLLR